MSRAWAGVDAGKAYHWVVMVDGDGAVVLSRRVANDEAAIVDVLHAARLVAEQVTWALDVTGGGAGLLLALLHEHAQQVVYVPGRVVNSVSHAYRGEGKTDARDARVIADQARMRRDFAELRPREGLVAELALLVAHRRDLVADKVRVVSRLRGHLTAIWPALERAVDCTAKGPLVLLGGYQTPAAVRDVGPERLVRWLRDQGVRNPEVLADTALQAAQAQHVSVPGEQLAARLVAELAQQVLALQARIKQLDDDLQVCFRRHRLAQLITSLPGMGHLLGAEFLVATGGDLRAFTGPDQLAAYAGLAPVPRDSGKRTGNLRRPRRYNRMLNRVFYLSALASLRGPASASRSFYDRKRAEGKRHNQAVIALARRRVNVLWALLRDSRPFQAAAPAAHAA